MPRNGTGLPSPTSTELHRGWVGIRAITFAKDAREAIAFLKNLCRQCPTELGKDF